MMYALQETFDKIIGHLRTQKACCVVNSQCRYKNSKGQSCAAGCLIPDELYDTSLEGIPLKNKDVITKVGDLIIKLGHNIDLVYALQRTHDDWEYMQWEPEFEKIAIRFKLQYSPIKIETEL